MPHILLIFRRWRKPERLYAIPLSSARVASFILITFLSFHLHANEEQGYCDLTGFSQFVDEGWPSVGIWTAEILEGNSINIEQYPADCNSCFNKNMAIPLSSQDMQNLCQSFRQLGYLSLPSTITSAGSGMHGPSFTMKFRLDGVYHRVDVEGLLLLSPRDDAYRFSQLWKSFNLALPASARAPTFEEVAKFYNPKCENSRWFKDTWCR